MVRDNRTNDVGKVWLAGQMQDLLLLPSGHYPGNIFVNPYRVKPRSTTCASIPVSARMYARVVVQVMDLAQRIFVVDRQWMNLDHAKH
eukprot:scaffold2597_cov116-Cylindrotheca_fusiformis.AAC.3